MSKGTTRQHVTAICYDKKGRILSIGRNSYVKTHPLQARLARQVGHPNRVFLHAEIDAIIRCRDWERIDTISIFRYGVKGTPLLAKPCVVCEQAIKLANIKKVVYTTGD